MCNQSVGCVICTDCTWFLLKHNSACLLVFAPLNKCPMFLKGSVACWPVTPLLDRLARPECRPNYLSSFMSNCYKTAYCATKQTPQCWLTHRFIRSELVNLAGEDKFNNELSSYPIIIVMWQIEKSYVHLSSHANPQRQLSRSSSSPSHAF